MARKPENSFIGRVNKHLPIKKLRTNAPARAKYPQERWIHYEKMNNPYRSGTADSWYSGNKGDLWIEYKNLVRMPQRADVKPQEMLSVLQLDWLKERYDEGRNVAVIVGCPEGGVLLLDRLWECSIAPDEFKSLIRSTAALAEWIHDSVG